MKLDLSHIFDGTTYNLELKEDLNIDTSSQTLEADYSVVLENPVNISGNIYATEDGVYLNAKINYKYIEDCARCLREFSEEKENVLSAKIIEKSNQQIQENEDEDETIVYYDVTDSILEIEDLILTSIELALPMKAICEESCKGLCSKCGVDLNLESCDCIHQEIDPRLEKLKDLFD